MSEFSAWRVHYGLPDNDESRRLYAEYSENFEILMGWWGRRKNDAIGKDTLAQVHQAQQ